ncbi:Methylamine utilisation protein MauE [Pedobacter westerhofensis]|uniref:Methylamine utilisation protein MauE n=1 Tax=Pedobacter westerhofensis TaxID=425512 RepID=A0A521EAN2_9SPHI|nr:Methylamine utilisation protein MauE [Pedobacter westerhofensis]
MKTINIFHRVRAFLVDRFTYINLISSLYILLFIYAGAIKLFDFKNFNLQLQKSPILSSFADVLSLLIPLVEIAISILLIIPGTLKIGLYAAFTLMSLFTVYIISILKFTSSIPCSCGGIIQSLSWNQHLIFNGVFLFMAVLAIQLEAYSNRIDFRRKI